MYVKAEIFNDR